MTAHGSFVYMKYFVHSRPVPVTAVSTKEVHNIHFSNRFIESASHPSD